MRWRMAVGETPAQEGEVWKGSRAVRRVERVPDDGGEGTVNEL